MAKLKVIHYDEVPVEEFTGGAQYRTLIAEENNDGARVITGIQISPPGYSTPNHSHPYVEIITVLEGEAEAWSETQAEAVLLSPGGTVMFPAHVHHGFRVVGEIPLKTFGIHLSQSRIVNIQDV